MLPEPDDLFEQLLEMRLRLQAFARTPEFKLAWKEELAGGGHGTTIMSSLFIDKRFYDGLEDVVLLFNHMILKTANEAVTESMGCVIDIHASPNRHLNQLAYSDEALVHWNGPKVHEATVFLTRALNLWAGKDEKGKQREWHFLKADRGARTGSVDRSSKNKHREWKVSKVVDRINTQPSRLGFMTG